MVSYLYFVNNNLKRSNGTAALPGQMGKLGVDRAGDHLCVDGMELVHAIAEGNDLSRADKRAT